jgi:hypothetical protein
MNSLAQLKKNRAKQTELLAKALANQGKKGYEHEEGYWTPTTDAAGNGWAVIRFLPAGNNEDVPFVQMISYSFKGPGGHYIEKSRTTLGKDEPDPAQEAFSAYWNAGDKEAAKKFPRRIQYIANILVVDDPQKPENNGKVFLFKFGSQIMTKIEECHEPKIPTRKKFNPFDLWEGANLDLVVGRKDKFPTYENSSFQTELKPVAKTDEELEAVYKQCQPLQPLIAPDKFKPYDVLKKRFEKVMNMSTSALPTTVAETMETPRVPAKDMDELNSSEETSLEDLMADFDIEKN